MTIYCIVDIQSAIINMSPIQSIFMPLIPSTKQHDSICFRFPTHSTLLIPISQAAEVLTNWFEKKNIQLYFNRQPARLPEKGSKFRQGPIKTAAQTFVIFALHS